VKIIKVAEETISTLQDLIDYWRAKGLSVFIHETGDKWELSEIVVPKLERNQGLGSEFMNNLISLADKLNKTIILTPDTSFGASSVNRLKRFYKMFGFVENKGRNKDFTFQSSMYRYPQ